MLLHQGGVLPKKDPQLYLLGCYLAAIMHDFEHRGLMNGAGLDEPYSTKWLN